MYSTYISKNLLLAVTIEYMKKRDRQPPKTITIFDKTKMTKTFEEYLLEDGKMDLLDVDTGNVYNDPLFLQRHREYEDRIKKQQVNTIE